MVLRHFFQTAKLKKEIEQATGNLTPERNLGVFFIF